MPIKLIRVERGMEALDIQMHWSSILTGAFLTLGFGFFFLLLGNAVGLNVANGVRTDVGGAIKFWSWIYMASTLTFSYFLGAFFGTRTARVAAPSSGILHALTAWSLATAIMFLGGSIASLGVRILLAGFASNSANWLAICVVGLGAIAAAMGGALGKYSRHEGVLRPGVEGERRIA